MELLASVLAFQAFVLGVTILGVLTGLGNRLGGGSEWLRLLARVTVYVVLAFFLFFSYSFLLSAAISISYCYFVLVFTALFGFTTFFIPQILKRLVGDRAGWFTRCLAAFGYAIILLLIGRLILDKFGLTVIFSGWVLAAAALAGTFWFLYCKWFRLRWNNRG